MARSEIEQDVGGLPDHELSGFQKRRGERRRAAACLHHLHHRGHAALAARDIGIIGAGFFQREPDIFAPALNARPVIEFVAHGDSLTRSLTRNTADRLRSYLSSLRGAKRRSNPHGVIPGWRVGTRPRMCNCTSGNPWIPGSMLRIAPE